MRKKGFPSPWPPPSPKTAHHDCLPRRQSFFATVAAEAGCRRPGTCPRPKSPSLFVWLACSLTAGTLSPAGAYPRKVTNSERGGLFPVWPVFLPPERPTARQSVCRLPAPSIVFVDIRLAGSSAASSALLSRHQACDCLAVRPGIRSLLARRGFLLLPYHGRDRRQGTCLARPARSARPALPLSPILPQKRGRRPQVVAAPWTWSCGMACEGAQTKKSPAERGQNRQSGGIEVRPLGDRAGARRAGVRHTKKTPSR